MKLNGKIKIKKLNKEFSFFFDNKTIFLMKISKIDNNQKESQYNLFEKINFDCINGKTTTGGDIYFFNLSLIQRDIFGNEYQGFCQSILIPSKMNSFYSEFNKIVFTGDIVNKFYPPSKCIYNNEYSIFSETIDNQSKVIKIKEKKEYTIDKDLVIDGDLIKFILSISINESNSDVEKPLYLTSYIELQFDSNRPIKEVLKWYKIIHQLFQFIFYKQEISFDKIIVKGEKETAYYHSIYDDFELNNDQDKDKFISHVFIIENIGKFIEIMNEKSINMYHLPKNYEEKRYLTPNKYVFTAASFEYEYNRLEIKEENINFKFVQNKLMEILSEIDEGYKGKNKEIRRISVSVKLYISRNEI